jgi:hypothetical protein
MSPAEVLLDALRSFGDLDWYGFSETAPHKVIWRWKEPRDDIGEAVDRAVAAYRGRVEWSVYRYDRRDGRANWCLLPAEVVRAQEREGLATDAAAARWLAQQRPAWSREAEHDFDGVVAAVCEALHGVG